jgi:hypothetical protein
MDQKRNLFIFRFQPVERGACFLCGQANNLRCPVVSQVKDKLRAKAFREPYPVCFFFVDADNQDVRCLFHQEPDVGLIEKFLFVH